jgi:hypothetical protein
MDRVSIWVLGKARAWVDIAISAIGRTVVGLVVRQDVGLWFGYVRVRARTCATARY